MIFSIALLSIFIALFIREVKKDRKRNEKQFFEADLHMLKELKKFYCEKNLDDRIFDKEIRNLEDKLK